MLFYLINIYMEESSSHTLHSEWTFWYTPRGRNSKVSMSNNHDYEQQLTKIGSCANVEEFFSIYLYL